MLTTKKIIFNKVNEGLSVLADNDLNDLSDKKTSFYQFGTKPSDKQKKKKGFEFQKSNYGKVREEPTIEGFYKSNLQKRNKERRRIKNLKAYKESQKKIDAKNQRHRMEISQAEWEEKWPVRDRNGKNLMP